MKLFRELLLSEAHRAAIVVGGGESAPPDLDHALEFFPDALILGVNQHASLLGGSVDYIVSYDNIHSLLREVGEKHGIERWPPVITYHPWADYRLLEYPTWPGSGTLATWIAYCLGCCPVILAGMDCYSTGGTYFHDADAFSEGSRIPVEEHVRYWGQMKSTLPAARIRSVSGPLTRLFPLLAPGEDFSDYVLPERLALLHGQTGKVVRITHRQGARVASERYDFGAIVEVPRKDAAQLFKRRRAVPAQPVS